MSKKDPAFLFYSKDWLEGTMELTPEEKGVYIDLLAHQHQKGSLPTDTKRLAKMVGLPESEFLPFWLILENKFTKEVDHGVDRMVNQKLKGVVEARIEGGKKSRIAGYFGLFIRSKKFPDSLVKIIKTSFKVADFMHFSDETLQEEVTRWLTIRFAGAIPDPIPTPIPEAIPVLGNGNATANNSTDKVVTGNFGSGNLIWDVESQLLSEQKNFEAICIKTYMKPDDAKRALRKYHLHIQETEKYPRAKPALYAGFEKWLMNEKSGNGQPISSEKKMHY